jgi:hypothetical protein
MNPGAARMLDRPPAATPNVTELREYVRQRRTVKR